MRLTVLIAGVLAALVTLNVVWRWASRRWSLPCPAWLSWGLESPWVIWIYRTEATLDRIGFQPGQRVLEIGPGPGRLLIPAARRILPGGEAVGIDIQPEMIDRLRERAADVGVTNLQGIIGDATAGLPPGEFDVIFLALTLGEIPNQQVVLSHCYAALRLGGALSITEMFPDPHFRPRNAVRRLAESVGFRHVGTVGSRLFFTANFEKPIRNHQVET